MLFRWWWTCRWTRWRTTRRRSRSPGRSPRWTRTWSGVEFGVKSDAGCDNSVDKGCWGIVGWWLPETPTSTSSPRQYPTSPPITFMNTFCLYNNQLQLLFSPDHVILLLGNLPGDKVLHLVHLPVLHLVQLFYNFTSATSNGFPIALMNTFVFTASSSNSYSSYNLPGDVVLHLVHLPVLHLLHLLFPHHLVQLHVHHLLNNINHFPNNFQKQHYHHRQKLRP